jgi:hypothetical protein
MRVVTLLTNINARGFNEFLKPSCEYYSLELVVLQSDQKYTTHRIKDIRLEKYLEDVLDEEIIFFSDGHDTAFLTGENEILEKFKVFNAPLVFSAEINCWPAKVLKNNYPASSHHFKYLNCGGFIGKAGFLKSLYKMYPVGSFAIGDYNRSNQYFWHHVYLQNQELIKIDHQCELFFNSSTQMDKVKGEGIKLTPSVLSELFNDEKTRLDREITFYKNRIKCNMTKTFPCHLHLPGPVSKMLMARNYFDAIKIWS